MSVDEGPHQSWGRLSGKDQERETEVRSFQKEGVLWVQSSWNIQEDKSINIITMFGNMEATLGRRGAGDLNMRSLGEAQGIQAQPG